MVYNSHGHIANEKDLDVYEKLLECENMTINSMDFEKGVCKIDNPKNKMQIKNSEHYVNNRRNIIPDTLSNPVFFQGYLKNHIGKLIRTESLIGNCLESRIGKLLEVGADYIVIKLYKSNCSMMINTSNIKYITIIHDNDLSKTFMQ